MDEEIEVPDEVKEETDDEEIEGMELDEY